MLYCNNLKMNCLSTMCWSSAYLIAILLLQSCESYNLENRLPLFKYGPMGSTFGFSVAQHRTSVDNLSGLQDTLMVVGAPTASSLLSQPGSRRPGGVFYCPVSTDPDDCTRVIMDEGGDSSENGIKSDQWLGVSLKSQGPGSMLISCAHRWRKHLNSGPLEKERVCGKCFLLNATNSHLIEEIQPNDVALGQGFISSPCELIDSSNLQSKRIYGYMQAGTSLDLHNDHYLLGAPGAWAWSGAMFDISMPGDAPTGIDAILGQGDVSMYSTPTCFSNERTQDPSQLKCDKIPIRRDSYMGFAVATSNAIAVDSDEMFYAAGAPRGNNTGAVILYKRNTDDDGLEHVPVESVVGEAIASSFGFSIALTDINGDGLDDLIVGAPQYYLYSNKGKRGGAVYVYINKPNRGFSEVGPQRFYGPLDSFFGYSVTALGDIDQDGFNDFAVGSPYENENGVVHIFRGSLSGKVKKSQSLNGMDYPHVMRSGKGEIKGFGSSLSGIIDADSNKYPDLLIGTLSDYAILFRTRPIISVEMNLDVRPKQIDLEQKNCTSGGKKYSCFGVRYCFTYTARHQEYTEDVKIKYKLTLDSSRQREMKSSRVKFESASGLSTVVQSITLPRAGRTFCPGKFHNIYFSDNVEDKLSDIGVDLEFDLDAADVEREVIGESVYSMIDDPILDADLENEKEEIVKIKTDCGDDGCQSDLKVNATMPEEIIVGGESQVTLTVDVVNDGEEAHQAFVNIKLPPKVNYNTFTVVDPSSGVQCYSGTSSSVRCHLGNPYKSGRHDSINIQLDVSTLTPEDKSIDVQVGADTTSTNPEIATVALQSLVIIELDLSLTVQSQPEQVRYADRPILGESAMEYTGQIGPLVVHTFNVENQASQPATGVELNVELPYEILNGKWLQYLVSSNVRSGGPQTTGSCGSSNVNYLQLEPNAPSAHRSKRSPKAYQPVAQASTGGSPFVSAQHLSCERSRALCVKITCQLDEIMPGTTTSVVFDVRVWEATLLEEFKNIDLVYMYTYANISTREENVRFKGDKTGGVIRTTVDHEFFESDVSSTFPWWYILIGVIVTLVIYILIIFFLVKCGFFRRKKYPQPEEEENEVRELDSDERKTKEMDESNI